MKINKKKINYSLDKEKKKLFFTQSLFETKKIIKIIYEFHVTNKRILFVNTPKIFTKMFSNFTITSNHLFLPETFWVKGLLTNASGCYYYLLKKKNNKKIEKKIKFLTSFFKKYDLVVIFESRNPHFSTSILKESFIKNIPIIFFNFFEERLKLNDVLYQTKSNFKFINAKGLIVTILASIIAKIPNNFKKIFLTQTKILKKKNFKFFTSKCRKKKKK